MLELGGVGGSGRQTKKTKEITCACYIREKGDSGKQLHLSIHGHSNQSRCLE